MAGTPWAIDVEEAVRKFLNAQVTGLHPDHTSKTPDRVVRALKEYVSGYLEDPAEPLETSFSDGDFDEMVHEENIPFVSTCAHHLAPIIGRVHFAYIPNNRVVGLSKIPRFIGILSRRLQVQEHLTTEITNCFQNVVGPKGCGVHIRAYHCCMIARGVREHDIITSTTSLRGNFKDDPQARSEFLGSLNNSAPIFL